jgi:hypothetical protein
MSLKILNLKCYLRFIIKDTLFAKRHLNIILIFELCENKVISILLLSWDCILLKWYVLFYFSFWFIPKTICFIYWIYSHLSNNDKYISFFVLHLTWFHFYSKSILYVLMLCFISKLDIRYTFLFNVSYFIDIWLLTHYMYMLYV